MNTVNHYCESLLLLSAHRFALSATSDSVFASLTPRHHVTLHKYHHLTSTPHTTNMAEEARQELENQLRQTIETLVEISLLVHDTTGSQENKEGLIEQMDTLVKEFQRLKEIKCDKQIPIDVIDYIDQGRNPDVYTREFVELLLKQNQFITGKMDVYTVSGTKRIML